MTNNKIASFFPNVMKHTAEGFGQSLGDYSFNMIGKMGDSIMASTQRNNKDKILKQMSLMYPQLSTRNKQKVDIAFEMICTLKPNLLNNTLIAGKIIDEATKSSDVLGAVKQRLSQVSGD